MKNLYYLFFVFTLVFTSCSEDKEVVDARDAFVGNWSETYDLSILIDGQKFEESGFGTISITKSSEPNEIWIESDGQLIKAKVNGTTFVIPVQSISEQVDGMYFLYDYTGNGKLVDGQLEYNITMKEKTGYNITISGKAIASKTN